MDNASCRECKEEGEKRPVLRVAAFALGVLAFAAALFAPVGDGAKLALYIAAYALSGAGIVFEAVEGVIKGEFFDENFLMTVATVGAFVIGEYPEGVAVMLLYRVGETLEDLASERTRKSVAALMDIRPDFANLRKDGATVRVSPEEVKKGDVIIVRPGEKIPLDGAVTDGSSFIDASALTGESVPRPVCIGDAVMSGTVNGTGTLTVSVTAEFVDSTVAKILGLVESAADRKTRTESFITRFARVYTPAVIAAAIAVAVIPPLAGAGTFSEWIYRALSLLVVSCPCALVISVPLAFFAGIGGASRRGILVKGSNFLEALAKVDTVVTDKTGTLTEGVFRIRRVVCANGYDESAVLRLASCAERHSNHPIAQSIKSASPSEDVPVKNVTELPGLGVVAEAAGKKVAVGNAKLMARENVAAPEIADEGKTVVHVAENGVYAGYIVIDDEIKADAAEAFSNLRAAGVKRIVVLTGDGAASAEAAAKAVGADEVHSGLLPGEKVERFEKVVCESGGKGKTAFVGDGVNDAPVIARADVGIAMGALGSDAAVEAADVVLMTDELAKIPTAVKIAKKTRRIVVCNIAFALAVKLAVIVLAFLGISDMWQAVFGDVGVTLIAVANSVRAMRAPQ